MPPRRAKFGAPSVTHSVSTARSSELQPQFDCRAAVSQHGGKTKFPLLFHALHFHTDTLAVVGTLPRLRRIRDAVRRQKTGIDTIEKCFLNDTEVTCFLLIAILQLLFESWSLSDRMATAEDTVHSNESYTLAILQTIHFHSYLP